MAARLKPLLLEIVFVGGCTTGLLISDSAASPVRATDDVDVIVEVASYAEYARFSKRLRNVGFSEDSSEGAPICRWLIDPHASCRQMRPSLGSRTAGTSL